MFLINALLVVLDIGLTFGSHSTNSFVSNNVCYELYDDVISDVNYTMTLSSCSVVCAVDECCSFMYNADSHRCITSSVYARNVVQGDCGWEYMINQNQCETPGRYTPFAPNTCDHGNSFKPIDNQCLESCDTYGSTFGKFNNYYLYGLNQNSIPLEENASSAEQENICLEICLEFTDFVCRTVEINPHTKLCHFSTDTALTQPLYYEYQDGVTLYHRNCA